LVLQGFIAAPVPNSAACDNGYFYEIVAAGTLDSNAKLGDTLTLAGAGGVSGLAYSDAGATGGVFALGALQDGLNAQTTAETSYSALQADLAQTFGSNQYPALQAALGATPTSITATGAGFTIDTSVAAGAAFTLATSGTLTIASTGSVSSSGTGKAVVLSAGANFINNAGANAVQASHGRWLIYSSDPASDTSGGLAYAFKQYNARYGVTPVAQASGNGFLYTLAPVLTAGLTGIVQKTYDGGASAALVPANYTVTGAVDGDTVTLNNPVSGTYDTKNAGSGKPVTVSGIALAGVRNGVATVYGYQLASSSISAAIGTIDPAALTLAAVSESKAYDHTTVSTAVPTVSGLQGGDSVSLLSERYDAADGGPRTLLVNGGYVVTDGNGGANYLVTLLTAPGSISSPLSPAELGSSVVRDAPGKDDPARSTPTDVTVSDDSGDPNSPLLVIGDPRFDGVPRGAKPKGGH
jgi:hypothetical protein